MAEAPARWGRARYHSTQGGESEGEGVGEDEVESGDNEGHDGKNGDGGEEGGSKSEMAGTEKKRGRDDGKASNIDE